METQLTDFFQKKMADIHKNIKSKLYKAESNRDAEAQCLLMHEYLKMQKTLATMPEDWGETFSSIDKIADRVSKINVNQKRN